MLDSSGRPAHAIFEGRPVPLELSEELFKANQFDGNPDNIQIATVQPVLRVPHHGPLIAVDGETGISIRATFLDAATDLNAGLALARALRVQG